jgi:hypothetical protein
LVGTYLSILIRIGSLIGDGQIYKVIELNTLLEIIKELRAHVKINIKKLKK